MEEQLKQTCLHDLHVGSGAKMSPFAGYDMPILYSGIIDEHNAVRHDVGVFDVSHMGEIFISGEDAEKFVNHIFTNDVSGMEPGKILYGMMCYDDGGTVDDLLVYREYAPQSWLLVVNASNIDKDYAWIKMQACRWKVEVDNQSDKWGQIAVQGPNAEKTVAEVLGFGDASSLKFYEFLDEKGADGSRVILSRTGYTGEDGFEIYAAPAQIRKYWEALLAAGVDALLLETFTSIRDVEPAIKGACDAADGMPVLVSFAIGDEGNLLGDGLNIEAACMRAQELGAYSVGINCCSIEAATQAVPRMMRATDLPVSVRPNSLLPVSARRSERGTSE